MYTLIDFGLSRKLFKRNGLLRDQVQLEGFQGNAFFASIDLVRCLTPSRKDDLESLLYILCYVYSGKIPIIEYLFNNYESIDDNDFVGHINRVRIKYYKDHTKWVKEHLPRSIKTCFEYCETLSFKDRPNYNLMKLYMSPTSEEEKKVFDFARQACQNEACKCLFKDWQALELP